MIFFCEQLQVFLQKKDQFLEQDPGQCQCDLAQQPQE